MTRTRCGGRIGGQDGPDDDSGGTGDGRGHPTPRACTGAPSRGGSRRWRRCPTTAGTTRPRAAGGRCATSSTTSSARTSGRSHCSAGRRSRTSATASTATCSGPTRRQPDGPPRTRPWPRECGPRRRRHGAPVLRRGVGRRVRPAAGRRPPRARLGPRRGHRRRPDARPGARRGRGELVRRARVALSRGRGGRSARPHDGRPARRPARALRPRRGLERRPRRLLRLHRSLRAGRRRRDHGPDDRRLRLRGDRPGARRGAPRRRLGRARASGSRSSPRPAARPSARRSPSSPGDRGVLRWRFDWVAPDGSSGHVRGVDVVRLQGGKVSEKLSYVKG